jgi:hypothetical protein
VKIYIGVEILNLGTRWRSMASFMPRGFTTEEKPPGTRCIEEILGATAAPNAVKNKKIYFACLESNSNTLIILLIV